MQELVKKLHGALEARPCLAAAVLDRHLPLLLQLPGALRLLLWALPAAHSSQALVYRRLCACFGAGGCRRSSLSSAMQLGAPCTGAVPAWTRAGACTYAMLGHTQLAALQHWKTGVLWLEERTIWWYTGLSADRQLRP